jgi:hypothetical protein
MCVTDNTKLPLCLLRTTPWGCIGRVEVKLHALLASALDGGEWSASCPCGHHRQSLSLGVEALFPIATGSTRKSQVFDSVSFTFGWFVGHFATLYQLLRSLGFVWGDRTVTVQPSKREFIYKGMSNFIKWFYWIMWTEGRKTPRRSFI